MDCLNWIFFTVSCLISLKKYLFFLTGQPVEEESLVLNVETGRKILLNKKKAIFFFLNCFSDTTTSSENKEGCGKHWFLKSVLLLLLDNLEIKQNKKKKKNNENVLDDIWEYGLLLIYLLTLFILFMFDLNF